MTAALLETAAASHLWEALITDEGEPFAAFMRGHVNPFTLAGDAEEAIIKAFNDLSPDFAADVSEISKTRAAQSFHNFGCAPTENRPMSWRTTSWPPPTSAAPSP